MIVELLHSIGIGGASRPSPSHTTGHRRCQQGVGRARYLPLGNEGSNLFFQVISARHEKKSTVITTNLPFADWGKIFDSTTVATAIADRLVNNSEVIILEGPSYRTKPKPKRRDDSKENTET
jgi:hypothetical protein